MIQVEEKQWAAIQEQLRIIKAIAPTCPRCKVKMILWVSQNIPLWRCFVCEGKAEPMAAHLVK